MAIDKEEFKKSDSKNRADQFETTKQQKSAPMQKDSALTKSKGSKSKKRLKDKADYVKKSNKTKPDSEVVTIFNLLDSLQKGLSGAEKEQVNDELLLSVRRMGAGGLGNRGTEYEKVKAAVDENDEVKNEFIKYLNSELSETRSWAASYIEQLFNKRSAIDYILEALSKERDGAAASWIALSLARLGRDNPRICDTIADAYNRFTGEFNVDLQIARAWGYAGCQSAAPVLAQHLLEGGYDQKNVALDGLQTLGIIEDPKIQPIIAEAMIVAKWEDIRSECLRVIKNFSSNSSETIAFLESIANGNDKQQSLYAKKTLEEITGDPWEGPSVLADPWENGITPESKWPSADEYVPRYTSDMPLGEEVVDCIDVEDEANAFAKIAAAKDVHPPLAVGVFGEWGSGKTFFMERIYANVEHLANLETEEGSDLPFCRRIVQIRFNAWHYMESNLWASLVDYIFQELDLWLHRQKEEQTTIDALFDRLSTARQLKLESVQAVIESRKERKRATDRLDNARKEYESALVRKSAYNSRTFWKAVFKTFKGQLNEKAQEDIQDASSRLGLSQLTESAESLNATIEEAATQAGRAQVLLRATVSKMGRGGALLCLIILLLLLPTCLVGLRAFLAKDQYFPWIANINDLTVGIAGIIAAITAVVGFVSNRAASALDTLQKFHKELNEAIELETKEPKHDYAAVQREVAAKEAELEQAERNLSHADENVEAAVQEWTAATPRGRLNRFIREKVVGGDYAKHLGIVAAIRKDFGQLAQMVSEGESDESSRQLYAKAQEEYKAEVARLIAEASDETSNDLKDVLTDEEKMELLNSASEKAPEVPSFERIILYIDDLDRCPPEKVVSVLQAIHLLLCFKLFVVVVAVDARWVSRALIKQYPELLEESIMWIEPNQNKGETSSKGRLRVGASSQDYLEKIFQIPYWVRPMDSEACTKYVEHLTKKDRLITEDRKVDEKAPREGLTSQNEDQMSPSSQADGDVASGDVKLQVSTPTAQKPEGEPVLGKTESDETADTKSDAYTGMYITDQELEILKHLAPFAGSSPRRGLRFVNVYRLIKTSLKKNQLNDLVGEMGEKLAYRAIIAQLAISTGAPRIAQYYFQIILTKNGQIKCIEDLIKKLESEPRIKSSPERSLLFGALTTLMELNEDRELDIGQDMIRELREFAPIARRFSFTARPT
jgi:multidrug efflux pump subunit AcrA (membrane-fusion protein)